MPGVDGGLFALDIWMDRPREFGGIGVFGAGSHGEQGRLAFEAFVSDQKRFPNRPDVFWIGAGEKDLSRKDAE